MRESEIERQLVAGIKKLGGRCYKWVSPGNAGVPDRIAVLPGGRVVFIELKTETGRLSKLQEVQIRRLRELGCEVMVLRGEEAVKEFLRR